MNIFDDPNKMQGANTNWIHTREYPLKSWVEEKLKESKVHSKETIIKSAQELVTGERAKTHGDPTLNHRKIADVWNGILMAADKLGSPLTAHDVANMMEGLKIARRYLGAFNVDDYVDGVGYAAVAGEIAAKQHELNKEWAEAAVKATK